MGKQKKRQTVLRMAVVALRFCGRVWGWAWCASSGREEIGRSDRLYQSYGRAKAGGALWAKRMGYEARWD